jgi:1-deoxy-D-xylulose-5-phosphate reductoisomerase
MIVRGKKRKSVIVLGSTGSIGTNALRVISEQPGFSVAGLATLDETSRLKAQIRRYKPKAAALAVAGPSAGREMKALGVKFFSGQDAAQRLVENTRADICLVAISGAAALEPTLAAIKRGMDIALASKEVLVMAGELTMAAVRRAGVKLLPVDSEHSALFQCLAGVDGADLQRLWLTASGGPFRGWPRARLKGVSRKQALAHPSWSMGPKISIDSATMMNKGLEVIEAYHLFGVAAERIKVVIHPQSLVHSMVELVDGSLLAQLSEPDMRLPIQYALSYPARLPRRAPRFDLNRARQMEFLPVKPGQVPCLELAYRALKRGGTAPAVLNASNEVAVAAFLAGELDFLGIEAVVRKTVNKLPVGPAASLAKIRAADGEARQLAERVIKQRKK